MNKTIETRRILVVDDHPIVRRGLVDTIRQEEGWIICGEGQGASDALRLMESEDPDLIILDLSLEDGSGLELIKQIRSMRDDLPILVVSIHGEAQYAERAIKAGAMGYINKSDAISNLVEAIHHVLSGKMYMNANVAERMMQPTPEDTEDNAPKLDCLTDREFEVLQMIGQGLGTRKIAEKLNVSIKTIETHRANLKHKLNLNDASELTEYAVRWVVEQE